MLRFMYKLIYNYEKYINFYQKIITKEEYLPNKNKYLNNLYSLLKIQLEHFIVF